MKLNALKVAIITFISIFAIYIGSDYSITYENQISYLVDTSDYSNEIYPLDSERLPQPVVVDIDNDGKNEMIILTYEPRIKIISWEEISNGFNLYQYKPIIKAEISLLSHIKMRKGRHPIALAAKYMDITTSSHNTKEGNTIPTDYINNNEDVNSLKGGYIIIVTEEWEVLCMNEHLRLLWTTPLRHKEGSFSYLKKGIEEVFIKISAINDHTNDGSVFILSSNKVNFQDIVKTITQHMNERELNDLFGDGKHEIGLPLDSSDYTTSLFYVVDKYNTLVKSIYEMQEMVLVSLSLRTGALLWENHDIYSYNYTLSDHKYTKVRFEDEYSKYKKEKHWSYYKSSLYKHLPHQWITKDDTSIELGYFTPIHSSTEQHKKHQHNIISTLFVPDNINVDNLPNSIVIHIRTGVYVFNIYNGDNVTSLALPPQVLHLPLHPDGPIMSIHTTLGSLFENTYINNIRLFTNGNITEPMSYCYIYIDTKTPSINMYQGKYIDLCSQPNPDNNYVTTQIQYHPEYQSSMILKPLVISNPVTKEIQEILFLTNDGVLTSLSPLYEVNFKKVLPLVWTSLDIEEGARPSLSYKQLSKNHYYIIITFVNRIFIMNEHKSIEFSFPVSSPPLREPLFADINQDGCQDIIYSGLNTVSIYTCREKNNNFIIQLIASCILILLIFCLFAMNSKYIQQLLRQNRVHTD